MTSRELLLVSLAIVAPWAIVLLVAILRGYDVTVVLRRRVRRRRRQEDDE